MSSQSLELKQRVATILAGVFLVLMTTTIAVVIEAETTSVPFFDNFIRPFTLAAAGLGTGHYLGRSMRDSDNIRVHFALGFFIGVFGEAIYLTRADTVSFLPYPAIVVTAGIFAFLMHFSPIIPSDEEITEIMNIFAGPFTTLFLIAATISELILSYNPGKTGWVAVGTLIGVLLLGIWLGAAGEEKATKIDGDR